MLGRLMDLQEQWRHFFSTRHRHWRRMGSRAAADNAQEAGGSGLSFLPSSFPRWWWQATSPAKQRKRNKQTLLFGFRSVQSLLFSFPPSLFFPSADGRSGCYCCLGPLKLRLIWEVVVRSGGSVGNGSRSTSPAVCGLMLEGLLQVLTSWLVMKKLKQPARGESEGERLWVCRVFVEVGVNRG